MEILLTSGYLECEVELEQTEKAILCRSDRIRFGDDLTLIDVRTG
jgi:hypothetical protein